MIRGEEACLGPILGDFQIGRTLDLIYILCANVFESNVFAPINSKCVSKRSLYEPLPRLLQLPLVLLQLIL